MSLDVKSNFEGYHGQQGHQHQLCHCSNLSSATWTPATLAIPCTCRYWLSTFQPHRLGLEGRTIHPDGGILDLAWAPGDTKFASASEDSTVCVWDLHTCKLQTRIEAHAGDCTSVHWHPTTSLLSSCSRDTLVRSQASLQPPACRNTCSAYNTWVLLRASETTLEHVLCFIDSVVVFLYFLLLNGSYTKLCGIQVKLWDARSGKQVTTYHGHQDRVNTVRFHWNGNWLISGSRDASCKLFDLRMNREMHTFIGHTKDINSIAWHPCVEQLFVTGAPWIALTCRSLSASCTL